MSVISYKDVKIYVPLCFSNYPKSPQATTIYGSFYVAKSDYNLINSKARSTLSTPAISDMVSPEDQSHIRVSMPYTWGINMKDMVQSFPEVVCGFSLISSCSHMVWYAL